MEDKFIEVIGKYRAESKKLLLSKMEGIEKRVISSLDDKTWIDFLNRGGVSIDELESWKTNSGLVGKKVYETWYRAAEAMDMFLFAGGEDQYMEIVKYSVDGGFDYQKVGNELQNHIGIGLITKKQEPKEIIEILLYHEGLYAAAGITESGRNAILSRAKKEFREQSVKDFWLMSWANFVCQRYLWLKYGKDGKDGRRQLRGDRQDWGKPRLDDDTNYDFLNPA